MAATYIDIYGDTLSVTVTIPAIGPSSTCYKIMNAQQTARFATQQMPTLNGMLEYAQIPEVDLPITLRVLSTPSAPFSLPGVSGEVTVDDDLYWAYLLAMGFQTVDTGKGLLAFDVNLGFKYFGDRGANC
jgi:hypothetical protein